MIKNSNSGDYLFLPLIFVGSWGKLVNFPLLHLSSDEMALISTSKKDLFNKSI